MKLRESGYVETKLDESDEGCMRMHFQFLQGGLPTGNNRVYPTQVLKKAVEEFSTRLKIYPAYGSDDHPKGPLEVKDVSHVVEGVSMNGDKAEATIRLLPTSSGRDLMTILKHGGRLGISARGHGSTKKNADGLEEIQDDYALEGVDFCLNPSAAVYAGKENFFESAELVDEEQKDIVRTRFLEARKAGFQGDEADYQKVFLTARKHHLTEAEEQIVNLGYAQAQRAGYRGSRDEYQRILLTRVGAVLEAITDNDGELTEEDVEVFMEALEDAVKAKYAEKYQVMDFDGNRIIVFDPTTSECAAIDFLVNDQGVVELTGQPLPISEE